MKGNNELSFSIDKKKIFFEKNGTKMFSVFQKIHQICSNSDFSEFSLREGVESIYLNEQKINSRNTLSFILNPYFNIENEIKLGAKTLLLKYLENSEDEEMLNISDVLTKETSNYNKNIILSEELKLNLSFNEIDILELYKMLKCKMKKMGLECNIYDLEYDDLIIFQLNLIEKLSLTTDKNIFITYIGSLTPKIINAINFLENENIKVFVSTETNHTPSDMKDYCIYNNKIIDVYDEYNLNYEIGMNLPFHCEIEELKKLISQYIIGDSNDRIMSLEKNL